MHINLENPEKDVIFEYEGDINKIFEKDITKNLRYYIDELYKIDKDAKIAITGSFPLSLMLEDIEPNDVDLLTNLEFSKVIEHFRNKIDSNLVTDQDKIFQMLDLEDNIQIVCLNTLIADSQLQFVSAYMSTTDIDATKFFLLFDFKKNVYSLYSHKYGHEALKTGTNVLNEFTGSDIQTIARSKKYEKRGFKTVFNENGVLSIYNPSAGKDKKADKKVTNMENNIMLAMIHRGFPIIPKNNCIYVGSKYSENYFDERILEIVDNDISPYGSFRRLNTALELSREYGRLYYFGRFIGALKYSCIVWSTILITEFCIRYLNRNDIINVHQYSPFYDIENAHVCGQKYLFIQKYHLNILGEPFQNIIKFLSNNNVHIHKGLKIKLNQFLKDVDFNSSIGCGHEDYCEIVKKFKCYNYSMENLPRRAYFLPKYLSVPYRS